MTNKYNIKRFKDAQNNGIYEEALSEICNGRKTGHWIWFIFPQMRGLGFSAMSDYYGISGAKEATAYIQDKTLSERLSEICNALLTLETNDAKSVMGMDWIKLRSSLTLFDFVSPNSVYAQVLAKYFSGKKDERTIEMLKSETE